MSVVWSWDGFVCCVGDVFFVFMVFEVEVMCDGDVFVLWWEVIVLLRGFVVVDWLFVLDDFVLVVIVVCLLCVVLVLLFGDL